MQQSRSRRHRARAAGIIAGSLAAAAALWSLRPAMPSGLAPDAGLSGDAGIAQACAWAAWLLGGYLSLAIGAAAAAELTGGSGVGSAHLRRVVPGSLRTMVETLVSVGVAASVLTSVAASPAGAATASNGVISLAVTGTPLDWPGLHDPVPTPTPTPSVTSGPPSGLPHHQHHHADVGLVTGGTADRERAAAHEVVVRTGDTLWAIAARHLPADSTDVAITAAWHHWYAANRGVIGADPSLLFPGQRLVAPPPSPELPAAPAHAPRSSR